MTAPNASTFQRLARWPRHEHEFAHLSDTPELIMLFWQMIVDEISSPETPAEIVEMIDNSRGKINKALTEIVDLIEPIDTRWAEIGKDEKIL